MYTAAVAPTRPLAVTRDYRAKDGGSAAEVNNTAGKSEHAQLGEPAIHREMQHVTLSRRWIRPTGNCRPALAERDVGFFLSPFDLSPMVPCTNMTTDTLESRSVQRRPLPGQARIRQSPVWGSTRSGRSPWHPCRTDPWLPFRS